MTELNADRRDLLWKQYCIHVDLYKFYLELTLKANVFYYGITGGILAYYFKNSSLPLMRHALLLPIGMSLVIAGIFIYGARIMRHIRSDLFRIRDELELYTAPEVAVLQWTLRSFAGLLFVTAVAVAVIYCRS